MNINLSKKAKIIIGVVVGVLVVAGVIGGSIAIANAVKKNKQAKCEHVYDEGQITAEATCEDPGMIVYTCGECKYELTEEIPANGHVESIIEAVPATCTAKGLTDGVKCVTCEEVLVAPVETPMLGHKVTALKAVAATCTSAGKTEGSMCSRCDVVLKEQTVIPAKGHTVVEVKGYAATCTEAGKTTGSKCSTCGQVYSEQEDIPALGHNVVNNACTLCGATNVTSYENYTQAALAINTPAVGSVIRIYKTANADYDGNFISLTGEFTYTLADSPSETRTQNKLYLGYLNEGKLMIAFEPISGGLAMVELTSETTDIKIYETEEFIDIAFMEGDHISFNGVSLYGSTMTGTYTIGSATTISKFDGEIYLLRASTVLVDSEVI